MDTPLTLQHKLNNAFQSILLIATMLGLLGLFGWSIAGVKGVLVTVTACALVLLLGPRFSPQLILRLYQAQEIAPHHSRDLYRIVEELSHRAELPRPPRLFYIPTTMLNAFAVGNRKDAAVALTDGLLRTLTPRELTGVIAHEISHIRHNDMWVMALADVISRVTATLAQVGLFLLLFALPLALIGGYVISLLAVLLIIIAPTLVALLQLALSRTREYDADRGAAELTNDPRGLAAALSKLERYHGNWLERAMLPGRREPDPSILRTHPPIAERIDRLLALARSNSAAFSRHASRGAVAPLDSGAPAILRQLPRLRERPHWHLSGLWF